MNQIHRLERAQHDLEFDDVAFVVPADHVNAIDRDTIELQLKFEDSVARSADFAHVAKRIVAENVQRCLQVLRGDRLADLWCVHNGRVEDDLIGKQLNQLIRFLAPDQLVPLFECVDWHPCFHFVRTELIQ